MIEHAKNHLTLLSLLRDSSVRWFLAHSILSRIEIKDLKTFSCWSNFNRERLSFNTFFAVYRILYINKEQFLLKITKK